MIDQLIAYCVRNKIIVFTGVIMLIAWGVYSLKNLPIDAVPDITNNQVQVITSSQTLAAQEVEQFITYPVEIALANIPGIEEIRSISRFGLSVVTVVFEENMDILKARQLVSERLLVAQEAIPEEMGRPELGPITTGLSEIYQYILEPVEGYEEKYSLMELRTIQDWIVKRQLLGVPGVAEVSSFGGYLKEYEVAVNPNKLRNFNLTIPDVYTALTGNNANTGSAYIEKNSEAYFIRGLGLIRSLDDIRNIRVATLEGLPVLVRDIAQVDYGAAVRYGALTNGSKGEAVGGIVLMLKDANSNQVSKLVNEKMQSIQSTLPEGVKVHVFLDRSDLISRAISTVTKNLVEGGLIVVFVLVLFLGNLRAGLVVASVIPLSMLFALGMMNLFGISGNLMSLGAIDFGLIVDGAVIIVEAIIHRLHKLSPDRLGSREDFNNEVIKASVKIRKSAAFGELIIMIVYLPILALTGIEGKMFKPMAITVTFAILGALILSMTYVPAASSLFLKRSDRESFADRLMRRITGIYTPAIRQVLKYKTVVWISALVLFVSSLFAFSRLGGEFIPNLDEGDFAIEFRLTPGSSLEQTVQTTLKAGEILEKNFPEVKDIVGKIGSAEIPTDPMPMEACDLIVVLKDKDEWTSAGTKEELAGKMAEKLSVLPGVEIGFMQPIQMRFNELMTGAKQDIVIKLFGEDLDILASNAEKAGKLIKNVKGIGDIYIEKTKGLPQIIVEYRREKMAQYGIDITTANLILQAAFAGEQAGIVYEEQKRFDLKIRLDKKYRSNIEDLKNLYVPTGNGAQIPMTEIADISVREGPSQISREKAQRKIIIGLNVRNRDIKSVVSDVEEILNAQLKLPSGYFIEYGGQFKNLEDGQRRLMTIVPIALLVILLLLYVTFNSVRHTLLIFTAIPFAIVGGIFSLIIRGLPFSISAGVGFIALSGVAVLNGIVMIAIFNDLKEQGIKDLYQRVIEGTSIRLRPVLMTATVASLGFIPMAFSTSAGAEVQRPLATVVIGGLITSTILTLFVLPVLYILFENMKFKLRLFGKILFILPLLVLLPFINKGQTGNPTDTISLDQAIRIAHENNPGIQEAAYEKDRLHTLKKTAVSIQPTSISGAYGQFDSFANDNSFTISQDFNNPLEYSAMGRLLNEEYKAGVFAYEHIRKLLERDVRQLYYRALVARERINTLKQLDTLYSQFDRFARLKFEAGESPYLEIISAETRLLEIRNRIFIAEADYRSLYRKLKTLIVYPDDFILADASIVYEPAKKDTAEYSSHPLMMAARQNISSAEAGRKLESARLLPGLSLGFHSQTLQGFHPVNAQGDEIYAGRDTRFNNVSAGLSIPIWFGPQKARIQAARVGVLKAKSGLDNVSLELRNNINETYANYQKYSDTHKFYTESALPQSDRLTDLSYKAYRTGEAGYTELLQNINDANQIKLNYLNILEQLNQNAIQLDYLLGGNQ